MARIGVVGLGSMGYGMASSCLKAGHETWGKDINPEAEARFRAEGGASGDLPGDLDALVIVVLNAAQTEAVLFGEAGLAARMGQGTVVISCATVPPEFARQMEARCAEAGLLYLDAPISGGAVKAAAGALSIMASGSEPAFDAARPVLEACAETVFELGDAAGPGSAMKAVNQLLAGVHIAAMSEALALGMTQGISPEQFLEVIPKCAGTSWMLENRAPHVAEGDYSPRSQVNIWPKDLGIVLDVARSAGFSAPLTATALQQYMVAVGMGLGAEDDAALTKVYARNAGLTLPGETT
ncbi:L-threonate dehydrogenase [Pseudoponticoccus marisrubri]|uniref:L-threonate dehydrogenase n=1 Tax=Pseudoponticoccus marisrubri TaxID=1685382 RepID=A0A0W7WN04_9RHOB|nr:L-threonate dehydrogenase [Pseudoponticoccus marisrubri]KUF11968.1 3-hydroxyisobutyrate dehydrogenase [Pseudoponticoccus marisrubri]